jgi:predicted ATPase
MLTNRIERLVVRNYRSLGDVDVTLNDLTVLVGPNGSGKSNFLDVLRFVSDALRRGLDAALISHERGGIGRIRRYSAKGRPYDVSIAISMTLGGLAGHYSFTLASERKNEYAVKHEECSLGFHRYLIDDEKLKGSTLPQGIVAQERNLTLPLVGNLSEFAPVYDFLTRIGFYSIFPNNLRPPQSPGNPYPLDEHGENLATVLREFVRNKDELWKKELYRGLSAVVPGIDEKNPIAVLQVGSYLVVRIKWEQVGVFDLALESDGTLRVLGILTALYQQPSLSFIGIEEPELMLHPQAMGILCDVLLEASIRSQVILTTHSPDLMNRFSADDLRLVERTDGTTTIGPISEGDRQAINDQLFGGGDLLRIGGLRRG